MSEKNLKIRNKFVDKIINKIEKINDDIKLLSKVDKKLFKNENNLIGGTDLPLGPPDWPPDNYERGQPPPPDGTNHIRPNLSRAQFKTAEIDKRAKEQAAAFANLKETNDANVKSIRKLGNVNEKIDNVELKVGNLADKLDKIKLVNIGELENLDIANLFDIDDFNNKLGDDKYLFESVEEAAICVKQYDDIWDIWSNFILLTLKSEGGKTPFNLEYAYYLAKQNIPDYDTEIKPKSFDMFNKPVPALNVNINLVYKKFRTKQEYDWWFPYGKFYKEYDKLKKIYDTNITTSTSGGTLLSTIILQKAFNNAMNLNNLNAAIYAHSFANKIADAQKAALFKDYIAYPPGHEIIVKNEIVDGVINLSTYAAGLITTADIPGDTNLVDLTFSIKMVLASRVNQTFINLFSDTIGSTGPVSVPNRNLVINNVNRIALAIGKNNITTVVDIRQALNNIIPTASETGLDIEILDSLETMIDDNRYTSFPYTKQSDIKTQALALADTLKTATYKVVISIVEACKEIKLSITPPSIISPATTNKLKKTVKNILLINETYSDIYITNTILDSIVNAVFAIINSFPDEISSEVIVAIVFVFVADKAHTDYMSAIAAVNGLAVAAAAQKVAAEATTAAAGAGAPAAMLPPAAILPPPVMLPPTIGNPAIAPNSILSMVIRNPFIVAILLEIIAYIMVLIAGRRANIITLNNKYDNTFPDIQIGRAHV
jgi:hypothetical protein